MIHLVNDMEKVITLCWYNELSWAVLLNGVYFLRIQLNSIKVSQKKEKKVYKVKSERMAVFPVF